MSRETYMESRLRCRPLWLCLSRLDATFVLMVLFFPSNDFLRQYQILCTALSMVVLIKLHHGQNWLSSLVSGWQMCFQRDPIPCLPSLDIRLAHGQRPVAGKWNGGNGLAKQPKNKDCYVYKFRCEVERAVALDGWSRVLSWRRAAQDSVFTLCLHLQCEDVDHITITIAAVYVYKSVLNCLYILSVCVCV